jgi:hypothetical protein
MNKYKVSIPRKVTFTECEVFYVEAESEAEAMSQVYESNEIGEFESQNDYETESVYDMEVEAIQ